MIQMIEVNNMFSISKYVITNEQYARFEPVEYPPEKANHPVVNVSWYQAMAYCAWLSSETNVVYCLPTGAEWELVARGDDNLLYPWGNEFDESRCNTWESRIWDTTPVGQFSPEGDSLYGVTDMAGNVREWCLDWKYPTRMLRGGSWMDIHYFARCNTRLRSKPDYKSSDVGFRIIRRL